MITTIYKLPAACLALALVAPVDTLRFAPEPGSVLTRHFSHSVELELTDMSMVVDGAELDSSMLGMEMSMSSLVEYAWQDTIHGLEDDHPTRVTRVYSQLEGTIESSQSNKVQGTQDVTAQSVSDLQDETIIFTWNPTSESFDGSFPKDALTDPKLLEGLHEDTDLRNFLPDGPVEKGREWSVSPDFLHHIFSPGGDLKLAAKSTDAEEADAVALSSAMLLQDILGNVVGKIKCTYEGTRMLDERSVQAIKVAIDVDANRDLTEFLNMQSGGTVKDAPDATMDFESAVVDISIEADGLLLWDPSAGHLLSFKVDGELVQALESVLTIDSPDGELHMEQHLTMSGVLKLSLATAHN